MQIQRRSGMWVLGLITGAVLVFVSIVPPLPQDLAYHAFADRRSWWGVPNTLDVLTNLAFLLVGGWGVLEFVRGRLQLLAGQHSACLVFLIGVGLTAFGSGWYHLDPNNITLVWDRLPMTLCFMALLALVVGETLGEQAGRLLLWPLLLAGVGSVIWWQVTESLGEGDLRWYAVVQFLPMLLLPMLLAFYRTTWTLTRHYGAVYACYLLAKLCESYDHQIFVSTGIIGGHSLKHLAAAAGAVWLVWMLKHRRHRPQ